MSRANRSLSASTSNLLRTHPDCSRLCGEVQHASDSVPLSSPASYAGAPSPNDSKLGPEPAMAAETDAAARLNAAEHEDDQESLTVSLLSSRRFATNSTSQVAIVGANVCPIESLDYEFVFPALLLVNLFCFASAAEGLVTPMFYVCVCVCGVGYWRTSSSSRTGGAARRATYISTCS